MKIEFLWFDDCPNHSEVRALLRDTMTEKGVDEPVTEINATDPEIAVKTRFPGSPTIRVDADDIEPGYVDPGDYTPRCRLYLTSSGLSGVPERRWIEDALDSARSAEERRGTG
jgi:hypothetical protein